MAVRVDPLCPTKRLTTFTKIVQSVRRLFPLRSLSLDPLLFKHKVRDAFCQHQRRHIGICTRYAGHDGRVAHAQTKNAVNPSSAVGHGARIAGETHAAGARRVPHTTDRVSDKFREFCIVGQEIFDTRAERDYGMDDCIA
jgi:hypothetical protein